MRFPRHAAAIAAALMIPALAAAQEQAPQTPPAAGGQGQGRVNRPQLTDEQREQIRTLDEQQRQTLETTRRELSDLHRQLNEQLTAAQIDHAKVNALRASIVQKETALVQARLDRLTKLSSILTAEQRQALRGRGLGAIAGGGRGAMTGPRGLRGQMGGRGTIQGRAPRAGAELRGRAQGLRGGRGVISGQRLRGGRGAGGGVVLRERGRSLADDARLRAEIRRLEAQLEALRRRIR